MAPAKKSKSVDKRFPKDNEESPDKDGGSGSKSRQRKRKLSDLLGIQWSKDELERFYEAYRKYGKDWKKVAGVVRNRSIEMVAALYNMNRAYLSLPEGTASVVGLIAMMTDHYNILEGSGGERKSNDAPKISQKPQKRGRGKFKLNFTKGSGGHVPDLLQFPSIASSYGCMPILKKKRSGGTRPRAVGKRTPRFPVFYPYDKHDRQQFKRGSNIECDANDDDEVAHGAALALAEALHRGGTQVSQAPNRRSEIARHSPTRRSARMHAESEMASAAVEDCLEVRLGSREAENRDFTRCPSYMMDKEGVGTVEIQRKGKKICRRKSKVQGIGNGHFDDVREACRGAEGLNLNSLKEKFEVEAVASKFEHSSPQGPSKRSMQLFSEDETSALDALYTLADMSMKLASPSTVESASAMQLKDEKLTFDTDHKSSILEAMSTNRQKGKRKSSGTKDKGHSLTGVDVTALKNVKLRRGSTFGVTAFSDVKELVSQPKTQKRKSKSSLPKIPKIEAHTESALSEPQKHEFLAEEGKKSIIKAKRVGLVAPLPERSSTSTDPIRSGADSALLNVQIPAINQVNLTTKPRRKRKMDLQKVLVHKELCSPANIGNERPSKQSPTLHDMILDFKEKFSRCVSSQMLRRWCAFEWFYSSIDYPWFAKMEFVEYLNHVGLGHVPRLTRVEWGVIRSSLGKPRRLSQQFLQEEKEKLEQYRESVRTHYTELRAGTREGLPTDLSRPLSVGQRVIACHPKTREFHDGSVLTVDRNRCRIQFDRPELGVEFVMDIDCMPLNPLENVPEASKRQNIVADTLSDPSVSKTNNRSKDWRTRENTKVASGEILETADGTTSQISSPYPLNTLLRQAKGDTINAISQAKAAASEIFNAQKATYTQPCTLAEIQAREADIQALSELTCALNKKEALVLELRHMNGEVYENKKDVENSLKGYRPFQKQYAPALMQLKEVNDQVSSALEYLRQRNSSQGNSLPWLKSKASSGAPVEAIGSFDQSSFLSQESGSRVVHILKRSRLEAQTMVDAAVQAISTLKEGEDAFASIRGALNSVNNRHRGADSGISPVRSLTPPEPCNGNLVYQDAGNSSTSETSMVVNANGTKANNTCDRSGIQIPKDLISSCVATFLMIQSCTERQYPPAEVAQILDSAVTSLHPHCSQNLAIYSEIQMCMGLVKNQIMALIPT